jgi:hypothetical protein
MEGEAADSVAEQNSSTCFNDPRAGSMTCHCFENQLATSLCGPDNHGSKRTLKKRRLWVLGDEDTSSGRGSWSSQVVSALTG